MNLRSGRSGPSKQGNNPQYVEISDEDDDHVTSDSSDYSASIYYDYEDFLDTAEILSRMHEKKEMLSRGVLDLNYEPSAEVEVSDGEDSAKRRRGWSKKERGQASHKRAALEGEAEEVESVDGTYGEEQEGHVVEIDFLGLKKVKKEKKGKRNRETKPTLMWEVWEEEHERWVEENLTRDFDLDHQNEMIAETSEAPSDLILPLLRYQKEWLAWALKQEESAIKGGILADEMGMGKTAQAIALVHAKREICREFCELNKLTPSPSSSSPSSSLELPKVKGTLVICPVVAVIQWVNEIERFTSKGSNKVLVYHGTNRGKSLHQFSEYDFVITTYSIVEVEYRKNVMPPKQKCQWCGKSFYDRKLSIHLNYFCGPDAVKTAKQSKQHKKGQKSGRRMSKQKTASDKGKASEVDSDKRKGACRKAMECENEENDLRISLPTRKSILHSVKWDRIILDEAHYIKDRRSNTTRAVLALESSYKWALSGTPLQNRVGELYSLVRFLQIVPYSYYFCKDCDCRTLEYSSSAECPNCPHNCVRHFCWWNRYIATPIQAQGNLGDGKRAMILLKHKILKSIVLRRTKKGRASDLALPPRIVSLRRDTLDIKEEDYYKSLYNESQAQFNTYVQEGSVMNNYAHIFDLLTRLRLAVDHPYLVVYSRTALGRTGSKVDADNSEQVCSLCHDPVEDPAVTSCAHIFCKSCLIDYSASVGQVSCPSCSKPLTVDFTTNFDHGVQNTKTTIKGFKSSSILNRIQLDDFQTSTKIEALREEIRFMVERDGSAKGIVFSQFTSFLDLIHYSLQKSGIDCVQLVGSMTMGARDAAITRFTEDPDCKIFLMSLKAGGVALNLTVASHVFLMDPWWNPAVERQAQDRIHRIGQYKPIRIVRFVIENTIEERMLKLQEKKELVFEGTVGGSSEALGKLTEADLRFLFIT